MAAGDVHLLAPEPPGGHARPGDLAEYLCTLTFHAMGYNWHKTRMAAQLHFSHGERAYRATGNDMVRYAIELTVAQAIAVAKRSKSRFIPSEEAHGLFDVVAIGHDHVHFVQVKEGLAAPDVAWRKAVMLLNDGAFYSWWNLLEEKGEDSRWQITAWIRPNWIRQTWRKGMPFRLEKGDICFSKDSKVEEPKVKGMRAYSA